MTALQEGSTLADHLLQRIGSTVGERVSVSTVFGEAVEREGITVIPVARARFAFGGGGGGGRREGEEGSGGGGGGAAIVNPAGYIEVRATVRRSSGGSSTRSTCSSSRWPHRLEWSPPEVC